MRRLMFYATVLSGVLAAYLMLRRGESIATIAKEATQNPVGALASEIQRAA